MNFKNWDTFTVQPETIRFADIEALEYTVKVKKPDIAQFKSFLFSEDVLNTQGGLLYPKGTSLSPKIIETLAKIKKKNPDFNDSFSLTKNKDLAKYFRQIIMEDIKRNINSRSSVQDFQKIYIRIEKFINKNIEQILDHDDMVYTLYNARSINQKAGKGKIPVHFYHTINTTIFSIIILQNAFFAFGKKFAIEDVIKIARAALMYDIGALLSFGPLGNLPREVQKSEYFSLSSKSAIICKSIGLDSEVCDCIKKAYDFEMTEDLKIVQEDDTVSDYANTLVTANMLDLKVCNLFEERVPLSKAMDDMFMLADKGKIKKDFLNSLAKGLKQNDLFDFYYEIEKLKRSCLIQDNARPYPMIGFKSPILIVCKGRRNDCPQYSATTSSVTLLRQSGDLSPGKYGRCIFLSKALVKFYESHYSSIKGEIQSDDN